jgi:type IV secretory pathway VirB3-like protein
MPVAIALILGVVIIALCLIGFLWTLIFLVPFYAWIAVAAYLMWRSKRSEDALTASVEQEAERQRLLNDQEFRAWQASLEIERRNDSRRNRVLRSYDRSRDLPKK